VYRYLRPEASKEVILSEGGETVVHRILILIATYILLLSIKHLPKHLRSK
jgi:hypothetical protein